jgi:hypothetical protein
MFQKQSKALTSLITATSAQAQTSQKRFAHTAEEASFEIVPFKLHNLTQGPEEKASLTRKEALDYYKDLVRHLFDGHKAWFPLNL